MSKYCIAITTLGNEEDAQNLINLVLDCELAACMQTLNIGSHYTWEGEVCHDKEVLVMFKTTWYLYDELEKTIKKHHPYETPEIIAIDIERGFQGYLDWIDEVTK